jgi:SAM-dependent methyltransferase
MTSQPNQSSLVRAAARRLPRPLRDALWRRTTGPSVSVRWGNMRRTRPFSEIWGADRGLPVDRRYIEDFVAAHAADVRGQALEIQSLQYIERYGGDRIEQAHVLDIDASNEQATIVGDLAREETLPEGAFDCFLLTQTLQFLPNPGSAAANAYRCLAPGGVLLLTVPTSSRLEPGGDYWRWTPLGLEEFLARALPSRAEREVTGHGNVLTMVAFLYGLGSEELSHEEYAFEDPRFPLVACARVRKP